MESRKVLLEWVNDFISVNLTKVEQCASGAVYLQIIDRVFYHSVPMHKVKWDARFTYQYVQNFKILQAVFEKLNIEKTIKVDRLVNAKLQDNLEFLQWIKSFADKMMKKNEFDKFAYEPEERRKLSGTEMPVWAKPSSYTNSTSVPPSPKETRLRGSINRINEQTPNIRPKHPESDIQLGHESNTTFKKTPSANGTVGSFTPPYFPNKGSKINPPPVYTPPIKELQLSIEDLKLKINKLQEQNDSYTRTINDQASTIESQKNTLCDKESMFESVNSIVSKHVKTIEEKQSSIENLQSELQTQKQNSLELQSKLQSKIDKLQSSLDKQAPQMEELEEKLSKIELDVIEPLKQQLKEVKDEKQTRMLEKEFYYQKLRRLEILCEENHSHLEPSTVLEILYATDDFIAPIESSNEAETKNVVVS